MTAPSYCTVTVMVLDIADMPVVGAPVQVYPVADPMLRQTATGWGAREHGIGQYTTDASGIASIRLPYNSESFPNSVTFVIALPDRAKFAGVVPNVPGPLDLQALCTSYGWTPYGDTTHGRTLGTVSTVGLT